MENQHRVIKGYRELTQEEIDLMNEVKDLASQVGRLVGKLQGMRPGTADSDLNPLEPQRWVSIGKTHLQQGFMALVRAIAQPTTF